VKLRVWTHGQPTDRLPVLLLHGGPGLPDYLSPVATMIEDLTVVHRYDQRGTGGSPRKACTPWSATCRTSTSCSTAGTLRLPGFWAALAPLASSTPEIWDGRNVDHAFSHLPNHCFRRLILGSQNGPIGPACSESSAAAGRGMSASFAIRTFRWKSSNTAVVEKVVSIV
jgi:hypothetical protein